MHMLDRRVHLLLDEERYRKLAKLAKREKLSIGALIREAVDRIPSVEEIERREEAIRAILSAEPMPVPDDPADLKREIDEMHERRFPDWS